MGLNIEYSIKYMFQDSQWKKKFLVGALFMLGMTVMNLVGQVSNFVSDLSAKEIKTYIKPYMHLLPEIIIGSVIIFLLAMILSVFTSGYFAKNINLRIFKPESNLLDWNNFSDMFFVGLKVTMATIIYFVAYAIMLIFPFALFIAFSAFAGAGGKLYMILAFIITIVYLLAISVILCFYFGAATLAFSTDLRFASYFNFSLINKFITKNFFEFFVYMLIILAVSFLVNIINSVLMITLVGIIVMPVLYYYQFLVQNDLAAQFIRNTLEVSAEKQ
ncbi:MAG: DUF4013 domain-containing protein [Clostridium sp.]|nr:DUF4013 domain-containing protein [Clostridium sp.]